MKWMKKLAQFGAARHAQARQCDTKRVQCNLTLSSHTATRLRVMAAALRVPYYAIAEYLLDTGLQGIRDIEDKTPEKLKTVRDHIVDNYVRGGR